MTNTVKKSTETESKILKTAIQLFAELGYEKTSMRLIAENSGITKPAVYYYYPDKESLFNAIIDHGAKNLEKQIVEIIDADLTVREKMFKIIQSRFSIVNQENHKNPPIRKFITELMIGALKYNCDNDMKFFFTAQLELFKKIIEKGKESGEINPDINSEQIAFLFIGILNIYSRKHYMMGEPAISDEETNSIIDILMNGIKLR